MATMAMLPMATTAMLDIPMPDFMVMLTMECHSDPALALTPSPRVLTPPPRDPCHTTDTDTTDTDGASK